MAQILLNKNTLHECEMNYSIYIFEDTLKKGLTKDLGEWGKLVLITIAAIYNGLGSYNSLNIKKMGLKVF